ncbi:MAG: ACP S-malonyltransferase [Desulfofustis sp.]|nr:ACP S-malonyltransferase [Desulfofustis sp.]NNK57663.1 ACP S-malonyltransferase [Desulfofustis sp.]
MKLAVLFPGQGSQYLGMGSEFIASSTECEAIMGMAASVCDFPLAKIIAEGPMEELTRAAVLQPAITVTNLICLKALQDALPESVEASCYAGHSLGEFSALCGAGVLSVADTIQLVERRGYLMGREGDRRPGGMRAILGLDIADIEEAVNSYRGTGDVTVANYNTPQQIVISGSTDGLDWVSAAVEEQGAKVIVLNVSVANHSPLVEGAVDDFNKVIDSVHFETPRSTVYFNVTAEQEDDPSRIRQMMARQIVSRVRWYEIISAMLADGVDTFVEVGPKTVLKGMMRKIVPKGANVTTLQFDTPESLHLCLEKLDLR